MKGALDEMDQTRSFAFHYQARKPGDLYNTNLIARPANATCIDKQTNLLEMAFFNLLTLSPAT